MEFRKSLTWPVIASLFLINICCLVYYICYSGADHEAYQKVLEVSEQGSKEYKGISTQKRRQVVKDVWFTRDDMPLQMHLSSTDSELILQDSVVIEKMKDVVCYVQEELFYAFEDGREVIKDSSGKWVLRTSVDEVVSVNDPGLRPMQRVRYIVADYATYHFQTGMLVAKEVSLSQYIVPGHTLVFSVEGHDPVMKGRAESLEISLLSKGLTFNAKKMTATF